MVAKKKKPKKKKKIIKQKKSVTKKMVDAHGDAASEFEEVQVHIGNVLPHLVKTQSDILLAIHRLQKTLDAKIFEIIERD